jgi:hypothetical protein
MATPITEEQVERIADLASAHPRSVWKRLAGGTLRPLCQRRVDRAIAECLGAEPDSRSTLADHGAGR